MKRNRSLLKSAAVPALAVGWLMLVLGLFAPRGWGADPAITDDPGAPGSAVATEILAPSTNAPDPADVAEPATEPPPRQRVGEVVSVGSTAEVAVSQSAGEVVVVHGDATIDGDVRGDVVVVFGKLTLRGSVRGDVVVVLGEAEIDGEIRGDTSLIMTRGHFGPRADVEGDVMVVGVPPVIDAGASLKSSPEVISLGPLVGYFEGAKDYLLQGALFLRPFPPRVGWVWVAAAVFLLFHLLIALVLSKPLGQCMDMVRLQPARSFLVGLIACVLVGPVSLLLSFTLIAPLLIWIAFFALCVFGRVTAYGAAGAAMARAAGMPGFAQPLGAVLLGSVVLYLCYMIPLVGLMVYGLALPLGVGAVTLWIFDAIKKERPPASGMPRREGLNAASALASGMPGPATHAFASSDSTPVPPSASATAAGAESVGSGTFSGSVPPPPSGTPPSFSVPPVLPRAVPLGDMEALASPRVGFWPRLGAALIDLVVIGAVNVVTFQSAQSFWVLAAIYHAALWAWKGTTLGGSVLNLRLVRVDGRRMDWQTAMVRVLGAVVSLVPLGLGFFWASWDAESQSWHDRIAGTTIVRPDRRVSLV